MWKKIRNSREKLEYRVVQRVIFEKKIEEKRLFELMTQLKENQNLIDESNRRDYSKTISLFNTRILKLYLKKIY